MSSKRAILFLLAIMQFYGVYSQISAPGSYLKIPADFQIRTFNQNGDTLYVTDTIFVFKTPVGNNFPVNAILSAGFHNTDSLIYQWFQFDPVAMLYNRHIRTDTAVTSTIERLAAGGYMVKIKGNGIDTVFRAWVYINYFKVKLKQDSRCDGVEFTWHGATEISGKSFNYYNFTDSTTHTIRNGIKTIWKAKKKNNSGVFEDVEYNYGNGDFTSFVFYDDHKIYLYVRDSLEQSANDSLNFFAISVKPKFKASRAAGHPGYETDTTGGAPFYVNFIDSSLNAELWTWKFYNAETWILKGEDSLLRFNNTQSFPDSVEYKKPGEYNVELITEGPVYYEEGESKRCRESLLKIKHIQIENSRVGKGDKMPNVFLPDSDNNKINRFRPIASDSSATNISLKYFEIYIYSRWGNRVYKFETTNKFSYDEWEGWNGKIGGDGLDAQAGIYFYVIKAMGLDGINRKKEGFVYLIRNQ